MCSVAVHTLVDVDETQELVEGITNKFASTGIRYVHTLHSTTYIFILRAASTLLSTLLANSMQMQAAGTLCIICANIFQF